MNRSSTSPPTPGGEEEDEDDDEEEEEEEEEGDKIPTLTFHPTAQIEVMSTFPCRLRRRRVSPG